ncbi:hypothetical protein [Candidiatus Paracoxiella cheracis]|uniref:hypothetical protein n=1 Tax=Candidiatus Paracoxiella cheracis TaxID=3405120 RepID=UPI003BF5EF52
MDKPIETQTQNTSHSNASQPIAIPIADPEELGSGRVEVDDEISTQTPAHLEPEVIVVSPEKSYAAPSDKPELEPESQPSVAIDQEGEGEYYDALPEQAMNTAPQPELVISMEEKDETELESQSLMASDQEVNIELQIADCISRILEELEPSRQMRMDEDQIASILETSISREEKAISVTDISSYLISIFLSSAAAWVAYAQSANDYFSKPVQVFFQVINTFIVLTQGIETGREVVKYYLTTLLKFGKVICRGSEESFQLSSIRSLVLEILQLLIAFSSMTLSLSVAKLFIPLNTLFNRIFFTVSSIYIQRGQIEQIKRTFIYPLVEKHDSSKFSSLKRTLLNKIIDEQENPKEFLKSLREDEKKFYKFSLEFISRANKLGSEHGSFINFPLVAKLVSIMSLCTSYTFANFPIYEAGIKDKNFSRLRAFISIGVDGLFGSAMSVMITKMLASLKNLGNPLLLITQRPIELSLIFLATAVACIPIIPYWTMATKEEKSPYLEAAGVPGSFVDNFCFLAEPAWIVGMALAYKFGFKRAGIEREIPLLAKRLEDFYSLLLALDNLSNDSTTDVAEVEQSVSNPDPNPSSGSRRWGLHCLNFFGLCSRGSTSDIAQLVDEDREASSRLASPGMQ